MGAGGERTTRANPLDRARALLRAQVRATPSADDTEVEATEADPPEPSAHEPAPPRPRRLRASGRLLGRYVIRRKLGSGGMALVYLADDPALQRKLAIKVIRPRLRGDAGRDRLLREAKAMALLEHPNVVPVFDVGTTGDDVYLVMPYMAGGTLGHWLAAGPRSWRAVLSVFVAAGRGLAAAHAKGLVHRDFKPDNVLLGADGEVRVADFGLAHLAHMDVETSPSRIEDDPTRPVHLTATGMLVGTPLYMSPEQLAGQQATPRSDQFSFCVALWAALYGERPFQPDPRAHTAELDQLREAIATGQLAPAANGRGVPGSLRAMVARGLRADPEARWPSLDHLVDQMVARLRRPRRTAVALGAVAVAAATIGAIAVSGHQGPSSDRRASGALAIRAPAGSFRTSRVTARGRVSDAALSPDGASLAWTVQSDVVIQSNGADPAGAHPRVVLRDADRATLAFSPDGGRLAVTNAPGRTRVVDVRTGAVLIDAEVGLPLLAFAGPDALVYSDHETTLTRRPIASPKESRECALPGFVREVVDLAAAPDGEVVLLIDQTDGKRALLRIGAGCEHPRLLRVDAWVSAVAASTDGFHALRRSDGEVSLVHLDRDGGVVEVRALDGDVTDLAGVAPDGRAYFVRTEYEWRLLELSRNRVTELASGAQPTELAGSPDGASIAWVEDGDDRRSLRIAPTERMADRPPPIATGVMTIAWAPDGRKLAAIVDVGGSLELVVMDLAGSVERRLPIGGVDADDWLAWLGRDSVVATSLDQRNLLRIDLATGAISPLLEERGDVADPQSRADGSLLLAWDRDERGAEGVWLRSPDGRLAQIREDADVSLRAAWGPGGRGLILYDRESGEVWRLARPGADPIRAVPVPVAGNECVPALWARGPDRMLAHVVRRISDLHVSRPE